MKSRFTILVGLVLALALVAAACSDDDDTGAEDTTTTAAEETTTTAAETTTTTTAETTTTAAAADALELVIWADEKRAPVLLAEAQNVKDATGVTLTVQQFEFADLRTQVAQAAPVGEGPDIFIGAHDWTGGFAADGITAPIDLGGRESEWVDVSMVAFNYNGSLYSVPYATEAIALYYNPELVPEPPTTFAEMTAICDELGDAIDNCLGIPGGADNVPAAAYNHYPWVSVLGGYIFAFDPATGYDISDVGLDSEEAIAGVSLLQGLIEDGYIGNVTEDDAENQFKDGTSPFFLSGPWKLGGFDDENVSYGVTKIPTADGATPGPFVGAQGFFINQFSENIGVAQAFLLDFVATEEVMTALYDADPRNPAYVATFEAVAADSKIAETFALSAADGQPMPNIPEMGSVWDPLSNQMNGLRNGKTDAETAMTQAAQQVRDAIGG
jgi:maltose-binding protein MalE